MNKQQKLQEILENLDVGKVYVNPPPNTYMVYPCVIMELPILETDYASNINYNTKHAVTIKYLDTERNISAIEKISQLDYCAHSTNYAMNNIQHSVFKIYI